MGLVLASSSPRRRELLSLLGVPFSVAMPPEDDAPPPLGALAVPLARGLALAKARAVAAAQGASPVLGADTVVALRGRALGKPASPQEALAMLRALRRRWHRVVTAVALVWRGRTWLGHAVTWVHFRPLQEEEIRRYVARGEPLDKAGGYAIQDQEFRPVDRYLGCYCNVVGLPLALVASLLRRAGIEVPAEAGPLPQCRACPLWARLVGPERPC